MHIQDRCPCIFRTDVHAYLGHMTMHILDGTPLLITRNNLNALGKVWVVVDDAFKLAHVNNGRSSLGCVAEYILPMPWAVLCCVAEYILPMPWAVLCCVAEYILPMLGLCYAV